ncbi:hypothetical protein ALDI51_04560 [Alicycliphilus denitrificans]|nr:hypothetical protein ALDI51_04560 [Alicycliphilus denitrificans]
MPASGKGTLRQSSAGLQASKASALAAMESRTVERDMAGIIPKQGPRTFRARPNPTLACAARRCGTIAA